MSPAVVDYRRYLGHWWILYGGQWARVTEPRLADLLDDEDHRQRLLY